MIENNWKETATIHLTWPNLTKPRNFQIWKSKQQLETVRFPGITVVVVANKMRDSQPHSDSDQKSGKERSGHESDAAAATVQLFFATRNRRPELKGIVIHFFNEIGFLNFSFQFEKLNYLSKWDTKNKKKTFFRGKLKSISQTNWGR